jgi:hypothetical protein
VSPITVALVRRPSPSLLPLSSLLPLLSPVTVAPSQSPLPVALAFASLLTVALTFALFFHVKQFKSFLNKIMTHEIILYETPSGMSFFI